MKNLKIKFLAILFAAFMLSSCSQSPKEWQIKSPDSKTTFKLTLSATKQLVYSVVGTKSGVDNEIVGLSPLGIVRSDQAFDNNLKFESDVPVEEKKESFTLSTGKRLVINSHWNEQTITFQNANGAKIQFVVRVYNDGVAFRYSFPDSNAKKVTVTSEMTGFAIAGSGKTWIQPYDKVTDWSPGYERFFENGIPVGTNAPSKEGWCFPPLFETDRAWVMLTEAAVDPTYFAAHMQPEASGGVYKIRMPEEEEAFNKYPQIPTITLPWDSPWRTIIIGESLAQIVESDMVVKLNPTSKVADVSWIKPGRATWSWWSDWPSPKDFNKLKKFVDFAAQMGWEYSLVDANWDLMTGGNIEELVKYANSKGVGILMWYNSGGIHNVVTERPRDIMSDPIKRKEEFQKLHAWGVKGVKVDFFQSDKQEIIKQYYGILEDAAANQIMVNFHGCTLPRGWNRTWPNMVTSEAVRGAESYAFDAKYPENAVVQNNIIPFTRNVVGAMDYTPVTFGNQKYPHLTTYGHELALSVVFESGILHLADAIEPYKNLPDGPKSFLKNVPTIWESTLLLDGYPGEKTIIARKANGMWYIGGINGTNQPQSFEVDLSRLESENLKGQIIADGAANNEFSVSDVTINSGDKLKVNVLPYGGFVATLVGE